VWRYSNPSLLFNVAVGSKRIFYVSFVSVISEWWIGKETEGNDYCIICGTIPAFAWKDWVMLHASRHNGYLDRYSNTPPWNTSQSPKTLINLPSVQPDHAGRPFAGLSSWKFVVYFLCLSITFYILLSWHYWWSV